jgi:hypothetical protein
MNSRHYITLDEFIRNVAAEMNDPTASKLYVKLLRTTKKAMRNLDVLGKTINVRSYLGTVDDNLSMPLPDDCIVPFYALRYYRTQHGDFVLPLIQADTEHINVHELIQSDQSPFAQPQDIETLPEYGVVNSSMGDLWYRHHPDYDHGDKLYFGKWRYDGDNNRLVFQSEGTVAAGASVICTYRSHTEECKMVPIVWEMALSHYVQYLMYVNSNPSASRNHFDFFRRHLREAQHAKLPESTRDVTAAIVEQFHPAKY